MAGRDRKYVEPIPSPTHNPRLIKSATSRIHRRPLLHPPPRPALPPSKIPPNQRRGRLFRLRLPRPLAGKNPSCERDHRRRAGDRCHECERAADGYRWAASLPGSIWAQVSG